jgi:hypothetical protein
VRDRAGEQALYSHREPAPGPRLHQLVVADIDPDVLQVRLQQ